MFIEDNKELINKAHFLEDFLDSFVSDTYYLNNIIFTNITDYLALITFLEEHILLSNKDEVNNKRRKCKYSKQILSKSKYKF